MYIPEDIIGGTGGAGSGSDLSMFGAAELFFFPTFVNKGAGTSSEIDMTLIQTLNKPLSKKIITINNLALTHF